MEEPRRLQFTTIGPSNREKKKTPVCQTIRISLNLNETNDETCPEFSYVELMKNTEGGEKNGDENNEDDEADPFGDDKEEDKLAEIAKKFEAKYGPKPGKGKRKPDRIEDLVDLGEGYDESDNFIDNSEAYDEIVPACLTTKLGGFYINSGVLDFREVSDDSTDDFAPKHGSSKKKRKAMRITSDSESEGELKVKKKRGPKPKKKFSEGFAGKKRKRLSADGEKLFKRPKKPIDKWKKKQRSPTISELLQRQAASTSSVNGVDCEGQPNNFSESGLPNGANIDSAIESVVSKGLYEDSNSQSDEKSYDNPESAPESAPSLPSNISQRLQDTITKLKKAAKDSREGKCRFFTHDVNRMLLLVELESQLVSCGVRQTIYTHLAAYLPTSKETLVKRAKKLRLNENDDKLKQPIQRLRDAINTTMPAQLERHVQECRLAAQVRLLEGKGTAEGNREDASTESDEEDKPGTEGGEKKRHMSPRRKFDWSNEIRVLLCEIVQIKMRTYDLSKLRAQSAEEYLKSFLETEIKPIWPKGWMQARMLYKESRLAHEIWTNPQKPKKAIVMTKAADSVSRGPSNSTEVRHSSETAVKSDLVNHLPSGLVSSTDDHLQRELKAGPSSALEQVKCQVTSTNKAGQSMDIPTSLDYAGHNPKKQLTVDSTVTSSKSTTNQGARSGPVIKPSTVDSTSSASSSVRSKPQEADTHNIAMEILKSMRQIPQSSVRTPENLPINKQREVYNNAASGGFLAQFQKYATSASGRPAEEPRPAHSKDRIPAAHMSLSYQTYPGEVMTHAQSLPGSQLSSPTRKSPPEKVQPAERKQSPFTLLNQQLEQQQQQQLKQKYRQDHGSQKEQNKKDNIPNKGQSKSPHVSPSSGDKQYSAKDGRQSPTSMLLNHQIQQHIQQNYLNLLQNSHHGVGQSKPPQPPSVAQTAKRQSLLEAAICSSDTDIGSGRPAQQPSSAMSASNSQDRSPGSKTARPISQHQQNQSLHSTSVLSLKKKLGVDAAHGSVMKSSMAASTQQKRVSKPLAMGLPSQASMLSPTSLPAHTAAWNLLSFVNSTTSPPAAHSSTAISLANSSAFTSPLAHTAGPATNRSSPNYQSLLMGGSKKVSSPTSSLHQKTRSPDSARAVVSSTVPYSHSQLSPRSGMSPHGSPMNSLYTHGLHSPGNPRQAASPQSMFPPMHGSPLQHPYTFSDLPHYRFPDSNRSPHWTS